MPAQVSGAMEAQQAQSPFHGMQGNAAEGIRESQGMMTAEQRQIPQPQPQPLRELSAPRMASPRFPLPQKPKPDVELQASTVDRIPAQTPTLPDSEASPTLRAAPTSLNQLLDNSGNKPPRPAESNTVRDVIVKDSPKSALNPERPLQSNSQSTDMPAAVATTTAINVSEAKPKPAVPISTSSPSLHPASISSSHPSTNVTSNTTPSLSQNPISSLGGHPSPNVNPMPTVCPTLSTNTNATTSGSPNPVTSSQSSPALTVSTSSNSSSAPKPSPSPKPVTSVHSVIQIPASSSAIPPNQITVFVTSNPITSAPTPQAPTSMASTMVAVPNKNIRPQDIRQQAPVPRPPQFIAATPVLFNPIFQVPGASVAPNTTMVSQSVTMVGPIQVSTTNIQLSPAPTSTQSSVANVTSTQPTRSAVGQVQIATSVSSSVPVGTPTAPQQVNSGAPKTENLVEAVPAQKPSPPVRQPSPHPSPSASAPFQAPLASPPLCSSPGAANAIRKSPMSPPPTAQVKGKPAQAAAAVSGTADSQQSPVERPVQGPTGAVPPQVSPPPASPAIQTEALVPHTTTTTTTVAAAAAAAAAASNNITPPAVPSPTPTPGQVAVPTQIITQAPVPATVSVSSQAQAVTSQAPTVTVVSATTGVSSATLLSTVAPVQSPVPSIVPVVPGPALEVAPTTSSPVANPGGVPAAQPSPPAVEPPMLPAAVSAEITETPPVPIQQDPPSQEPAASEKTGEEVSTGSEQGWAKKRKTPINLVPRAAVEKPKGPSRRSSRAEKEVEEEPVADSGIRKRSARPGTSAAVKETGASPTQAKRRKSK
ncbi:uncharacterized protein LOC129099547 isoform X1 [Anoplopoma fimbria]|uniref:uncharacterized protein LOC129099547 isoform X1 n=1 Tax=Anoplopoma fimbria TaxID=229290 RepID=UPI0023EBE401|nr:uncharacterized protein LOC129099547 isoform X1 [Anoplopoma fimbria]